jgi:hypothetical protein
MSRFEDKYAIPEPVDIVLEDATFSVLLPTSANKRYERAIAAASAVIDSDGNYSAKKVDLAEMIDIQHKAFVDVCLLTMNGKDFDKQAFLARYPGAVEDLNSKARELVDSMEEVAIAEVGKSQPSSTGQKTGQTKSSSTSSLKSQAV